MRLIIAAVFVALASAEMDICIRDFYSRGHGAMPKKCEKDTEYSAGFCYKTCKDGYDGYGPACMEKCDEGFTDLGVACSKGTTVVVKESYNRGLGSLPTCDDNYIQTLHLCFDSCKDGYEGMGPVCWLQHNGTEDHPTVCNSFIFGKAQKDCDKFSEMMKDAKLDSKECLSALATAIMTRDIVGGKQCVEQVKSAYEQFKNIKGCKDTNYSYKDV